MRRRLWLAAASLAFVGWRRVRSLGQPAEPAPADTDVPRVGGGRRS